MVAEAGFEPSDLWVMSPTSYRTAPLRDIELHPQVPEQYNIPRADCQEGKSTFFIFRKISLCGKMTQPVATGSFHPSNGFEREKGENKEGVS